MERYDLAEDMLRGADEIAAFLGTNRRRVYHLTKEHGLPVFHEGCILAARKSTILTWVEKQEARE